MCRGRSKEIQGRKVAELGPRLSSNDRRLDLISHPAKQGLRFGTPLENVAMAKFSTESFQPVKLILPIKFVSSVTHRQLAPSCLGRPAAAKSKYCIMACVRWAMRSSNVPARSQIRFM